MTKLNCWKEYNWESEWCQWRDCKDMWICMGIIDDLLANLNFDGEAITAGWKTEDSSSK